MIQGLSILKKFSHFFRLPADLLQVGHNAQEEVHSPLLAWEAAEEYHFIGGTFKRDWPLQLQTQVHLSHSTLHLNFQNTQG